MEVLQPNSRAIPSCGRPWASSVTFPLNASFQDFPGLGPLGYPIVLTICCRVVVSGLARSGSLNPGIRAGVGPVLLVARLSSISFLQTLADPEQSHRQQEEQQEVGAGSVVLR